MANTLLRHWQMLSLVPRAPRKVSTAMLQDQLQARGFVIDKRSIQRDLVKLSAHFTLISDERSKPFGWSWARSAPVFDVPGMDMHTALAFALAGEHLANLLPNATLDYMLPHIQQARGVLDSIDDNELSVWRRSVRVLPSGQPMAPTTVDPAVLEGVHDGLLHQRQLKLTYIRRGETRRRHYTAHPIGLVYKESIAYLVCSLFAYPNALQLVLHRIQALEVLDEPRRIPEGVDLDAYIEAGEFGFRMGTAPIALVVDMDHGAAARLYETPLADDQVCEELETGRVRISATVADTAALRVWLKGYGALCEVREPTSLRREMAEELAAALSQYRPVP